MLAVLWLRGPLEEGFLKENWKLKRWMDENRESLQQQIYRCGSKKQLKVQRTIKALVFNVALKIINPCCDIMTNNIDVLMLFYRGFFYCWELNDEIIFFHKNITVPHFSGKTQRNRNQWSLERTDQISFSSQSQTAASSDTRCHASYRPEGNPICEAGKEEGSHQTKQRNTDNTTRQKCSRLKGEAPPLLPYWWCVQFPDQPALISHKRASLHVTMHNCCSSPLKK